MKYSWVWKKRNYYMLRLEQNLSRSFRRLYRKMRLVVSPKKAGDALLIAGPFVGELGYEIGEWMPFVKYVSDTLQTKVHVFTRKGHEVLYPFAETFHTYEFPTDHVYNNWLYKHTNSESTLFESIVREMGEYAAEHPNPKQQFFYETADSTQRDTHFKNRKNIIITASQASIRTWKEAIPGSKKVVLVCRFLKRGTERNSDIEQINKLADYVKGIGYTPVIVGKTDENFTIGVKHGINLINRTTLADLVAIYRQSTVIVGNSTGTIHLAAACDVPHITWGSTFLDDTVIRRYQHDWNLNRTWVRFLSKEWHIPFDMIVKAIEDALLLHRGLIQQTQTEHI